MAHPEYLEHCCVYEGQYCSRRIGKLDRVLHIILNSFRDRDILFMPYLILWIFASISRIPKVPNVVSYVQITPPKIIRASRHAECQSGSFRRQPCLPIPRCTEGSARRVIEVRR